MKQMFLILALTGMLGFIIEGKSPGVANVYYSGNTAPDQWFIVVKNYLDRLYGESNYSIHFGPNLLDANENK